MSGFTDRENQLFDIISTFTEHDLPFIVIGDYAVSAAHHRFSVDADLVIPAEAIDQFTDILTGEGYEKVADREFVEGRFLSYTKDSELPVSVDLMVGAVHTRQTGATWSYEELAQTAKLTAIEGSAEAVRVRIPATELLVAMKLHSARLTDARDVVALAADADFDQVAAYLDRGNPEQVRASLEQVNDTITGEGFADAFKGVFAEQEVPETQIAQLQTFLREQIERIEEG